MSTFDEATRLASLRLDARTKKNWQEADRLRDEISLLGYKVLDTPDGFALEELTYSALAKISDLKPDSITFDQFNTVICLVIEGWLEDTLESLERLLKYTSFPIALLDLSQDEAIHTSLYEKTKKHQDRLTLVVVNQSLQEVGWAIAHNQLIQAVRSENVVVMDISTLFEGDAVTPLLLHLKDDVAAVGWKGANVSADWLNFETATGSVDALLSYLFVVKRKTFLDNPFDSKAKFYRNADLEWSMGMKSAGFELVAVTEDLPCTQGRHHGYHDSEETYRQKESKRNYDRLLAKFRGKPEIVVKKDS